jgi:hypothetical protein
MKTYEVTLNIRYVKRYIANSPEEAMEAMDFDYINLYIDEEMCEEGTPQIFNYSWNIEFPEKVKNDKTIYARDVRGTIEEAA